MFQRQKVTRPPAPPPQPLPSVTEGEGPTGRPEGPGAAGEGRALAEPEGLLHAGGRWARWGAEGQEGVWRGKVAIFPPLEVAEDAYYSGAQSQLKLLKH